MARTSKRPLAKKVVKNKMAKRAMAPKAVAFAPPEAKRKRSRSPKVQPEATEGEMRTESRSGGYHAINGADQRKSRRVEARIEDTMKNSSSGPNPAKVFTVPRPPVHVDPKARKKNLAIVTVDIGNYTTTASRVLGLGMVEDFEYWTGAALARQKQIRTRAVASKFKDGWELKFGPETDEVCEKEGEIVVFDNMKLSMNPGSIHFHKQKEKEDRIGEKDVFQKYITWVFKTLFDSSRSADPDIDHFKVYTNLPAEWPEKASYLYQCTIQNIPGFEGKADVVITCEATCAINGRLGPVPLQQRKTSNVYLAQNEYGGVVDIGDATVNITIVRSDRYQPVVSATALAGFGNLNMIVDDILRPSQWLKDTFADSDSILNIWMQGAAFLKRHKPLLGSEQLRLEIHGNPVPDELVIQIQEKVLEHFDVKLIKWSSEWLNKWCQKSGHSLKWIATSGGGAASEPFQERMNGRMGPFRLFHSPKNSCGEDVEDGLKLQPHIHSTFVDYQFNYGFGQDLDNEAVGSSAKPQHVTVFAEKGQLVPDDIPPIAYFIPEPLDGNFEIDVTILKSSMDLSKVPIDKELDLKVVKLDGWTELASHKISLPFNLSGEDSGGQRKRRRAQKNKKRKSGRVACVYLLRQLRGIQIVVHAIGRFDGEEDIGLCRAWTSRRQGYEVDIFKDSTTYFHRTKSTPTRILGDSEMNPIVIDSDDESKRGDKQRDEDESKSGDKERDEDESKSGDKERDEDEDDDGDEEMNDGNEDEDEDGDEDEDEDGDEDEDADGDEDEDADGDEDKDADGDEDEDADGDEDEDADGDEETNDGNEEGNEEKDGEEEMNDWNETGEKRDG